MDGGSDSVVVFSPLQEEEPAAIARAAKQLGAKVEELEVVRRSLDARKGHPIGFRLEIARLGVANFGISDSGGNDLSRPVRVGARVVIVGTGPAGTFAAERLTRVGAAVTLVDIGKPVQPRRHDLAHLTQRGELDIRSNYCFGEGGAGTFSDGKLYTRSKDRSGVRSVLQTLVEWGAPPSILVDSRPHIGSNRLPKILIEARERLEQRGAQYVWGDGVVDLLTAGGSGSTNGRVVGVRTESGRELIADAVLLAIGHSARPLYERLAAVGVAMEAKAFAVGARIEHPQSLIDKQQYGNAWEHPRLPASFYELTAKVTTTQAGERGVYSFCMCPGGWVVDSATEEGALCTNGMSLSRRDSPLANAALVVTVEPRDYGEKFGSGPLAGLAFQRAIERAGFEKGGGKFRAPAQRASDFIRGVPTETPLKSTYRPSIAGGDVRGALPEFVADALTRALARFERSMPGFANGPAQFVGVETRTSAPVRIVRDARLTSPSHPGLYPCGEGAGYAGGIVSAALDGLRCADAMVSAL